MAISYKRLLKLLIDKGWQKKDLVKEANISWTTMAKFNREDEYIDLRVVEKICQVLNCQPNDIMEIK